MAQYTGEVRWFNNAKGYGFLGREGGPDVFVHYTAIEVDGYKTLKEGDRVTFDVITGDKGPQADKVKRLETPQSIVHPGAQGAGARTATPLGIAS